jgi:hypothetical protein
MFCFCLISFVFLFLPCYATLHLSFLIVGKVGQDGLVGEMGEILLQQSSNEFDFGAILRFESVSFGVTKEKASSTYFCLFSGQTELRFLGVLKF